VNGTTEGNGIWKSEGVARRFKTTHIYNHKSLQSCAVALLPVGSPSQTDEEGKNQMRKGVYEKGTSIQIPLMLAAVTSVVT